MVWCSAPRYLYVPLLLALVAFEWPRPALVAMLGVNLVALIYGAELFARYAQTTMRCVL